MLSPTDFYDALPKHKIELIDGKVYIGGSLEYTRMLLAYILRGYGPTYISALVEKELLRNACIEAFGREKQKALKLPFPSVPPSMPVLRMGSELAMNLFQHRAWGVYNRDCVVKLGEDAFTPDIFVYTNESASRHKSYYFDGAPELIIEILHPAMRTFDEQLRLNRYRDGRVPEIWMIDYERETITVHISRADSYTSQTWDHRPLSPQFIKGLTFLPANFWKLKEDPWQKTSDLVIKTEDAPQEKPSAKWKDGNSPAWGSISFRPEINLAPVSIPFEQFISWAPEAKFEWWDGKPHIGGGEETNLHLTGLLLMTLGLVETVGLVGEEFWGDCL